MRGWGYAPSYCPTEDRGGLGFAGLSGLIIPGLDVGRVGFSAVLDAADTFGTWLRK
jgi:hypothetical protein